MTQPLILVADDNRDLRLIFRAILEAEGYGVVEAGDGVEAVERAREHTPDLAFLDLMMPGMNGWQALDAIRARPETSELAVIAITASQAPARELREAGFCALLRKPIRPAEVVDSIDLCLEAYRKGDRWVQLPRMA